MAGKKQIAIEIQIKNIKQIKVLENQLKKLRKEQRALAKTNEEAKKLSGEEAKMYDRKHKAITKASKALRENKKALADVNKGANATKKSSGSLTKSFIKGAAAVGILISAFRRVNEIISSMLGIFTSFEFVMAKVQAVSGANADEFKRLSDTAQELGRSTFFTAEQVGQLQLNYSKLGFTTSEILAAQRATLDLAVATGSDLARAAIVAGAAVRGFGLDAAETQRVVDVMAVSFSSSAMDMEKWQTAMTKVAPIAKAAGFSIEDTAAIMSKLTDTGIEASIAGTSLRNILLKMQDPSSDLTKVFGTTIHSLDQLVPAMNKFVAEGGDMADVMGVVDIRQAAAFESMVTSADATLELRDAMLAANGEGSRMAGIVGDTLHGAWLKFKSAMEGMAIVMMEDVGGALKDSLVSFAKWLNALIKGEKQLEKFKKAISKFFKIIKGGVTILASYWLGLKTTAFWTSTLATRTAFLTAAKAALATTTGAATAAMTLYTRAVVLAKTATNLLATAIARTGIGALIIGFIDAVYYVSTFNDEIHKAIGFTEGLTKAEVELKEARGVLLKSSEQLIEARETINNLTDDEGKLINKTTENIYRLKKARGEEGVALNRINGYLRTQGDELVTVKDNYDDIKTAIDGVIKKMGEQALAKIFYDQEAAIISTKVKAESVMKEFMEMGDATEEDILATLKDLKEADGTFGMWMNELVAFFVGEGNVPVANAKTMILEVLDKYGVTIGTFVEASGADFVENATENLKESVLKVAGDIGLEDFTSQSLAELLSGQDDPELKPKGELPTETETFKVAYDERIKLLIDSYRKQKEVEVAYQDGHKEMVLLDIYTLAEEKIKAQIKANQAEQKFRNDNAKIAEKAKVKGVSELDKKIAALKAKEAQLLLDLDMHYISEKERLLGDEHKDAVIALELEESTTMMSKIEFTNRMLLLEADYLQKKAELHAGNAILLIDINNDILKNNVAVNKTQQQMLKEQISAMGGVGSALTSLAGDNEKLNFIKEAGNKISEVANILSAISTLQENLATIATIKGTAAKAADMAMELASLPGKALSAILNQGGGDPYTSFFRIIAMIALIGKVMGMFEKGGIVQEYARGGMVNGKSHAQGGEKFNAGGRVVELEGGEAVINKRSTSMFRDELSSMNQAGGGVKFADGGLTNLPSFTKTHFDVLGQQGMMGAMGQGSRVVVVESDITETQNTVSVIESQATF